jgi:hypothetical protein
MRFAINSSDANDVYSFFMPIVSRAWKSIGYQPVSLLHGDEAAWSSNPKDRYVLGKIRDESKTFFIDPVPDFKVATVTQVSRLAAASISEFNPEDYLLTSDADMIPLSREYFNQQDTSLPFHIFSADAYGDITQGHRPYKFPICYLGGEAKVWRRIMCIDSDFNAEVAKIVKCSGNAWDHDENYFHARLIQSHLVDGDYIPWKGGYRRGECHCMIRTWPGGHADRRIDRDGIFFDGRKDLIDCHYLRPGYSNRNLLLNILETYFPSDIEFFKTYVDEFMSLKERHG